MGLSYNMSILKIFIFSTDILTKVQKLILVKIILVNSILSQRKHLEQ